MTKIKSKIYKSVLDLGLRRILVNGFHRLYYGSLVWDGTYWLGIKCEKCPLDLWIYQEVISDVQPDIIIETGASMGGSALFLASICDLVNRGRVVTIDIEKREVPKHERIEYVIGSSVAEEIVNDIRSLVNATQKVMVILDSDHSMEHVLKELRIYSQLVSVGSYLIVEDTNIDGHPVLPDFGPEPMEAVKEFLRQNDNFVVDESKQKFFLTFNPRGYFLRVK
jgi:cephalosporin hydroxylase